MQRCRLANVRLITRRLVRAIPLFSLATIMMVGGTGAESLQLPVNGRQRTFIVEGASKDPRPTLIMLHGAGADRTDYYFPDLAQIASKVDFVIVRPQGVGGKWNIFPTGKVSAADTQFFERHGGIPDDVGFLKMVIGDLIKRGVSDPKRMHLAGMSLGGVMALRLVCEDIAFAGVGVFISAMPDVFGASCRVAKPLRVLLVNGTADPRLPYAGGRSASGETIWSAERLYDFFRGINGCVRGPVPPVPPGTPSQKIVIDVTGGCPPVHFYRVAGGGHDIPRSLEPSRLLMDFFIDKIR
jgi:polyhydroxybutyrate depolymerase